MILHFSLKCKYDFNQTMAAQAGMESYMVAATITHTRQHELSGERAASEAIKAEN